jgi:adenylate cyclase class 2
MPDAAARYEVELKFRVTDPDRLMARLEELGATWGPPVPQSDRYFAHPSRDFAATDEALRLRTIGDQTELTYKGPVIDKQTKTRREIEVPLAPGVEPAVRMVDALVSLGFRPVREVAKTRRSGNLTWQARPVQCTWDDVPPLGTYLELEVVTDDAGRAAARDLILDLAAALGLSAPERRSYLELLLASDVSG